MSRCTSGKPQLKHYHHHIPHTGRTVNPHRVNGPVIDPASVVVAPAECQELRGSESISGHKSPMGCNRSILYNSELFPVTLLSAAPGQCNVQVKFLNKIIAHHNNSLPRSSLGKFTNLHSFHRCSLCSLFLTQ